MNSASAWTLGLFVLCSAAVGFSPAHAQTIANGPYYATPSWDQTLPSHTRFIVLSNFDSAAVLDRETGLVWERSPDGTSLSWFAASIACLKSPLGKRQGWRLPGIQELLSLRDPSAVGFFALPNGHPFIIPSMSNYLFWSTTVAADPTLFPSVYTVPMTSGGVGVSAHDKSLPLLHRWCVRGGQGVDPQ